MILVDHSHMKYLHIVEFILLLDYNQSLAAASDY